MYNNIGHVTWEAEFDIYGKTRSFAGGSLTDCPFRYQGQYEDSETGLYYNRFRYYDADMSGYLSQDPIGLAGNNPTFYEYVKDVNSWVDVYILTAASYDWYPVVKKGIQIQLCMRDLIRAILTKSESHNDLHGDILNHD
jgi:RHS repeat-associated protein